MLKHNLFRFCLLISSVLIISAIFTSCKDDPDDTSWGNWVRLSDLDGLARYDAVSFVINEKGYVGTGFDGDQRMKDFWEYDPVRNAWSQKADFPGAGRNSAVGLSISGKGYIGTGYDDENNKLNDFWEFNPDSNTWNQKADFAGTARYGAVGFSLNDKGYVGAGYSGNYEKDMFEYNPTNDQWTQVTSIGGSKRRDAVSFTMDGKAYICTGINNGSYVTDFWEFDPSNESTQWIKLRDIADVNDDDFDNDYTSITGINKVAFVIGQKAYLVSGGEGSTSDDVWIWDSGDDTWEKADEPFEGSKRSDAVAFGIGNRGYVTTGHSGGYIFDDIWALDPDSLYNNED